MVGWISRKRQGPIGVDLGSRSVKLMQLTADRRELWEASRWDLPLDESAAGSEQQSELLTQGIIQAQQGRRFRGRDAVICLGMRELFVQNVRVPKSVGQNLEQVVRQEVAGRVPFESREAEIRYMETDDVRQGDQIKREIIVMACHRPVLESTLKVVEAAGLRPIAVDVEPAALLRCYRQQFRRDEDRQHRSMVVQVGAAKTAVIITRGDDILFVKYIEIGGRSFDEAVAYHLKLKPLDASALRRHNGDRRVDQQDPEIASSVQESIRPVIEQLTNELSLCVRYHSVTFRGQPLTRLVLSGGESSPQLLEAIAKRLDLPCEMGDPLRTYPGGMAPGRHTQWDVAAGLALRLTE